MPTSEQANQVWVRFYGRFVYVVGNGELTALALNFTNSKVKACRHDAFMTISEPNVDIGKATDSLNPTYLSIGTELAPGNGGRYQWSIAQRVIDVPIDGGFKWADATDLRIANLGTLSGGKIVDEKYLRGFVAKNSPVQAVIRLHGGEGTPYDLANEPLFYRFVPYGNTAATSKDDPTRLADMIQVVFDRPADAVEVTFIKDEQTHAEGTKIVRVRKDSKHTRAPSGDPLIISFSNLCPVSSSTSPDTEFAGLYDVLIDAPDVDHRKIPILSSAGMQPFGDCFLGAMISG